MSTPKSTRLSLLEKLSNLGRTLSTQTIFLHQAIAQTFGLNATDTKCIDLMLTHPDEPVTPGWLSAVTGLTSGAITHILDRLEKRNLIERVRDARDRRKLFIKVRMESLTPFSPRYEAIGRAFMEVAKQYDDKQLHLICDYMERNLEISRRELAKLVASSPARPPKS
ncbi:MAG TPA: MarR family transcriptional regulator [Candidatus Eisenbacteria bacterium]|nr:MarR family transcriptional regulator [Candidatus Eisenbacteria bacterium]